MITITAATGRYGRLVIEALLRRGVPAPSIVAAVRSPEKAADLAAKGVQVREADYDRPETLTQAFAGADKLLLIPSVSIGQRYAQMERALNAAAEAGVGLIAYAGFINGEVSTLRLGDEHKQTEALIRKSGLPYVLLRNGAYIEMYAGDLGDLGHAIETGILLGAAGEGKVSGASRDDLAQAAAVVLSNATQDNAIYELGGSAFTMGDVAAAISLLTGKALTYQNMPVAQYTQVLLGAGLPTALAEIIADTSCAIQRGDWYNDSTDLPDLLGRPSTPLVDVVAATLKSNGLV
ncbi:SDR family oxidoreductase [Pseudomonas sp. B21-056]|uniref:SDR family oxidoreductase n=1 Tax=Pseudomonas sp. B21-056 TaxID=2895495 RepID=UPI00223111D3|nr:SDR family oxidoreductase [Pseudomonas sp. B21-056]UZE21984.1 SDR family oxidoreductase [Pseudomonas sp. B21-056]